MVNVTELGREHGEQYAVELWHADPPDYDMAREWCATADAGTLHDYHLPSPFDDMPNDLTTEGWSWGEIADYEGAWTQSYLTRTTDLMRALLASYHDQRESENDE